MIIIEYLVLGYNIQFNYFTSFNADYFNQMTPTTTNRFVPAVLYGKITERFYNCMEKAGYTYAGPIVDIQQSINEMKETMNDINNTINEEPNEEEANTDLQNMIPDTTTDITSGGFNTIFDTIRNEFINPTNKRINITIPFTNKSFIINTMSIYGGKYFEIRNSVLGQLITSFWWFSLGYFIYSDIAHIINKVKSGNIEDIENTNIKEDLL